MSRIITRVSTDTGGDETINNITELDTTITESNSSSEGAGVSSYNDLTDKPVLFDGDYDSLTDQPDLKTINGESILGTGDLVVLTGATVVDAEPTEGSANVAQSGGVFNRTQQIVQYPLLFKSAIDYDNNLEIWEGILNINIKGESEPTAIYYIEDVKIHNPSDEYKIDIYKFVDGGSDIRFRWYSIGTVYSGVQEVEYTINNRTIKIIIDFDIFPSSYSRTAPLNKDNTRINYRCLEPNTTTIFDGRLGIDYGLFSEDNEWTLSTTETDLSSACYDPNNGYVLLCDNALNTVVVADPADGSIVSTLTNIGGSDSEDITYCYSNVFSLLNEDAFTPAIKVFSYTAPSTSAVLQTITLNTTNIPLSIANGLEGISYDSNRNVFYLVQEGSINNVNAPMFPVHLRGDLSFEGLYNVADPLPTLVENDYYHVLTGNATYPTNSIIYCDGLTWTSYAIPRALYECDFSGNVTLLMDLESTLNTKINECSSLYFDNIKNLIYILSGYDYSSSLPNGAGKIAVITLDGIIQQIIDYNVLDGENVEGLGFKPDMSEMFISGELKKLSVSSI